MSHCALEATLKPKRFEFTPKTVITDVFIAQVYWVIWLRDSYYGASSQDSSKILEKNNADNCRPLHISLTKQSGK